MIESWKALDGYTFKTGDRIVLGSYGNNDRPALSVMTSFQEPMCTITVNLDEEIADDEFFVKLVLEDLCPELLAELVLRRLAHPTNRTVSAGFVERYARVWKLGSGA